MSPADAEMSPFAILDECPDIWKNDPRSAAEIAEELKSDRRDIDNDCRRTVNP